VAVFVAESKAGNNNDNQCLKASRSSFALPDALRLVFDTAALHFQNTL
jgi:hypothetical protein